MNILKSLFGSSANSITVQEAKERLKDFYVIDVRQPDEYRGGHIAGSKLVPLHELNARLNELPKDREILCVCRSGARSGSATGMLNRAGLKATNMNGGMSSWQRAGFPIKTGK